MRNISSYQLGGTGMMIDGVSYQIASASDVLESQNRIKKELGLPLYSKDEIKTNLVISGDALSPYTSEEFSDPEGKNKRTIADVINEASNE